MLLILRAPCARLATAQITLHPLTRWLALSRTLLLFADRIRWAPKINQNCFSLALLFVVGHVLCTFRTSSFGWVVVVILPTTPLAQIDHLVDERVAIH